MSVWTELTTNKFIELYKNEPVIWDTRNANNKDAKQVRQAWARLSKAMGTPLKELKKQRDRLMDEYILQRRKRTESVALGIETAEWSFLDAMESFLKDVCELSTLDSSNPVSHVLVPAPTSSRIQFEDDSPGEVSEPKSKQRRSTRKRPLSPGDTEHQDLSNYLTKAVKQLNQTLNKNLKSIEPKKDDLFDIYGKLLAIKLRDLTQEDSQLMMYEIDGLFLNRRGNGQRAGLTGASLGEPREETSEDQGAASDISIEMKIEPADDVFDIRENPFSSVIPGKRLLEVNRIGDQLPYSSRDDFDYTGSAPALVHKTEKTNGDWKDVSYASAEVQTTPADYLLDTHNVYTGMLEDLPSGHPMERPLHPKRRRLWSPCPSTSQVAAQAVPSSSQTVEASPRTGLSVLGEPVLEPYQQSPGGVTMSGSSSESVAPPGIVTHPPSPAPLIEYIHDTPRSIQRSRQNQPLEEDDISSLIHSYGSEDDEEGMDDDEDVLSVPIPRCIRAAFGDEDEEQEPLQEQLLDWPLPVATEVEQLPSVPRAISPSSFPSSLNRDDELGVHKPTDLFEFQWQAFPDAPIPPNLRRETFAHSNPGPGVHYACPYDAFIAIWDRQIMTQICEQTNLYAQQMTDHLLATGRLCPQSRVTKWKDIDTDELYVYFAIVLAMGIVVKSRLEEYWSTKQDIFLTSGFSAHMPINRFLLISRWLHFNNNHNMHNLQLSRAQAKLFKVQPIIDHLNLKFSTLYNLSQNIALDESLTQWKGWLDINQIIPNKAAAVGIKTYEICESHTGYLWRFEIHASSESSQDTGPVSGAIPSIILRLIRGLEFKGHTLWMDNNYNSPALARTLKSMQFDCVGTLRTNRPFVPVQLATLQKAQMVKGQIAGCTSGDVDLLVWRDKNRVSLISTYHSAATTRCGDFVKPTLMHDYNLCMGGVDKKDQMLAMYPIERKRIKIWYKKLFRRLLNVSVLNSYIMYKLNTLTISHRDFRLDLVRQLLVHHHHQQRPTAGILASTSIQGPPKFSAEVLNHLPSEYGLLSGGKGKIRRTCVVCKERTHTYCPGCNVPLCTYRRHANSSTFSCFRTHHS